MKRLTTALLVAALAAVGCGEESEPGGPGAAPAPTANGNGGQREMQNKDNTFTMTVPSTATDIQAGGSQAVTLEIDRGEQFNEAVTLEFNAPPGIEIAPQQPEIGPGVESVDVTISADQTARPGEHRITVTATPASGQNPVTQEFTVEIEAAENGGEAAPRGPERDPANPPAQPTQP